MHADDRAQEEEAAQGLGRELRYTVLGAVVLIAAAFAITFLFVKPAPPKKLVLASAPDEGGARYYARRYSEILKRNGVTLEIRQTSGSIANLALLNDEKSGVDVAFVQSGLATADPVSDASATTGSTPAAPAANPLAPPTSPGGAPITPAPAPRTTGAPAANGPTRLPPAAATTRPAAPSIKVAKVVSLGSLAYVPLWVFYRGDAIDDVRALRGKRIGVGANDSGTRALAVTLLGATGAEKPPTVLSAAERDAAIDQLAGGELDALFLISPAESPIIQRLAAVPGIHLLSNARGDAYVRRYPYLSKLHLPRGVFDLAGDVPDHDVDLLSPTSNLLARDSLHPALAYLLMRAASEVHGAAGMFDKAGEFPAAHEAGFPLSSEAKRYYAVGVPFLQKYLPFWAANLVDRLWVMLVPILAVVIPLGRAVPALYRWRIRSRVFKWYAHLKAIEASLQDDPGPEALNAMLARLDRIEHAVNQIKTPLAYTEHLYIFREHVDVVRRRLHRRLAEHGATLIPVARTPAAF